MNDEALDLSVAGETDDDPESMLAEIRRARTLTRTSLLTAGWRWLVLWGVILLGSVVSYGFGTNYSGRYWLVAGPLGAALTTLIGYTIDTGKEVSAKPYLAIGATMLIVGFGCWAVFEEMTAALVWWVVIAGGMALIALLDGQRLLTISIAGLLAWGVVIWTTFEFDTVMAVIISGLGGLLLGAGAALRMVRPTPRR